VTLIVVLMSIATVEPIEYGLVYSSLTKKVDSGNVYAGGWYFLGPFSSFINFPATLVNMDYTDFPGHKYQPITCRDNDN